MSRPWSRSEVEAIMATENPVASLRETVIRALDVYGMDRGRLLFVLDGYRRDYRDSGRDHEENAVTEIMERLVGWCGPDARL